MKIKKRSLVSRAATKSADFPERESEFREVVHLVRGALFERAVRSQPKVSPAVAQLHPDAEAIFKDSYLVDFLSLPEAHSEQELQTEIIVNLGRFLLELGRDFAFVGEQYLLPVGGQDFRLDL